MKTAVIYARYSSDKQTEQSIEGQLRVCNDFANRNKILVVGTYIDRATTGTNDNRIDFQRMMRDSSKKDVTDFITHQLKQEPDVIIQLLVKKVIIYDDKVEIIFNYTHKKDTLDSLQECPFYIEKISKTIKNTKINRDDYELNFEISAYFWLYIKIIQLVNF